MDEIRGQDMYRAVFNALPSLVFIVDEDVRNMSDAPAENFWEQTAQLFGENAWAGSALPACYGRAGRVRPGRVLQGLRYQKCRY